MTSLTNTNSSKLQFRVNPVIYTVDTLDEVFEFLNVNNEDLVVTNGFIKQSINLKETDVINVDDYGNGEPKDTWVNKILEDANKKEYKRIVAIGGGAVIDISKYISVSIKGDDVKALFDKKEQLVKQKELVAIPSTCGTGSEVTSVAVVERSDLNSKLGLQTDALYPNKAILCEELLKTMPFNLFASTSIDALSHAIESYLSPKKTMYSAILSEKAIKIILNNLKECSKSHELPNLKQALIAANMAGIAFSIGGCATMHANSFPLGANYHLPHGLAVYATLEACLKFYANHGIDLSELKETIASAINVDKENALEEMYKILDETIKAPDFNELGVTKEKCHEYADSVYKNQQRLLVNSPITLSTDDIEEIFISCIK